MNATANLPNVSQSDTEKRQDNHLVYSYITLRNLIGICGMLLPIVLLLTTKKSSGDLFIEPSISDYYYTSNGDMLVLLLSILGGFLFTYNGYTWQEKLLAIIAACCSIGIAFSPTATTSANSNSIHIALTEVPKIFGIQKHHLFAIGFFTAIAIIALKYFPKTDKPIRTAEGKLTQKGRRNAVYKLCGSIILVCTALLIIYFFAFPVNHKVPVIFILETIAIEAFGFSWITKGQTLWPDAEHYMETAYREIRDKIYPGK